ncbi:MAG TPA: hypothetical protein VL691_01235 [Vicinamibacteria bacterium]|nr:hypothetical protein [Vicinamibacteria bacterium]
MVDRLDELQSAVRDLTAQLRRLEARVRQLEGRAAAPVADAPPREAARAARPAMATPQSTMTLLGRTLLVLAGAYVARAMTDGRVLPAGVGVALGLAYAVFWQLRADREARAGRRESAVFHALASSLIAFPLLWEATVRFSLLGPRVACAALAGFFALGLGVAWRQGLTLGAWVTTGLTLVTVMALLVGTHDLVAVFAALLAISGGLEWLAYRERWLPLRWSAALLLDAVAFLLAVLVARPQGLPDGYVPLSLPVAAAALFALPALYVLSLAARTLRRGRPVTLFEVAQGTLAILLGFGGAFRVLAAHGARTAGLGALALLLGALCYGAAFAFAERRAGQGRNFYFYSTAGGLLTLAGVSVVATGPALPCTLGGLGLATALLGRRLGRMTLRVHAALYLTAGTVGTGLFAAGVRALAGQESMALPSLAWAAGVAAGGGWAVLATDPRAPRSGWARGPQVLLAVLVVLALAHALHAALWVVAGDRMAGDPGLAAVARTAVLAAVALGLALCARRGAWPELGWLVYPLVALGGVKLLLQDLREGRPATLVLSLALYGALLLLAPRLLKSGESRAL